jgi:hypothetical protein
MSTEDKLLKIDKQLKRLEERRKKLFTRKALSFYKATTRIFKDGFCPDLALKILSQAHETAVAIQKQEEESRARSFRCNTSRGNDEKPQAIEPTDHQSGRAEI